MKKNITSILLAISMILTIIPVTAITPEPMQDIDYSHLSLTPGADETEMRFTWHSASHSGAVTVFEEGNQTSHTFPSENPRPISSRSGYYVHQVSVTGLTPDTVYQYRLYWQGGNSANKSFRTGGADNFQFLALADIQLSGGTHVRTGWMNRLSSIVDAFPNAGFMLSLGDQIASNPNHATPMAVGQGKLDDLFAPPQWHNLPLAALPGNHDGYGVDNMSGYLWRYHYNAPNQRRLDYSFERHNSEVYFDHYFRYGNTLFINLSIICWATQQLRENDNDNQRRAWFADVIETNSDAQWTVVSFHNAPYSVGRASIPSEGSKQRMINNWISVFDHHNIDIVLNGHDHAYSRSHHMRGNVVQSEQTWLDPNTVLDPVGIPYIALGSAFASSRFPTDMPRDYIAVYESSDFSVVDVTADTFSIVSYRTDGDTPPIEVDRYTIVKSGCITCTGVCGQECEHPNCEKIYLCGICLDCALCVICTGVCGQVCQHPNCEEIYLCGSCVNCNPCVTCTGVCGQVCEHPNCEEIYLCGTCVNCNPCITCIGVCGQVCEHSNCKKIIPHCGICVNCNPCITCTGVCGQVCEHSNCKKIISHCSICEVCKPNPCANGHNQGTANCTQCTRCNTKLSRNCTNSDPCAFHMPKQQEHPIGNGLIFGNSTTPGIADALEIFKFLAGMDNVIHDNGKGSREWNASLITETSRKANKPQIGDALEIFKMLAGMDSVLK